MTRVGFQSRFAASLIDAGIIAAALHVVLLIDAMLSQIRVFDFGVLTLILGGVGLVLYGLLDVYVNGTPGKKMLKLTIAADDGSAAPDSVLLRRWAVKHAGVLFAAVGIGMISVAEGPWRGSNYDTREVLVAVGIIDICLGVVLMLIILVTTMAMLFKPQIRPLHDTLTGTSVFRSSDVLTQRGFELVVGEANRIEAGEAAESGPAGRVNEVSVPAASVAAR